MGFDACRILLQRFVEKVFEDDAGFGSKFDQGLPQSRQIGWVPEVDVEVAPKTIDAIQELVGLA